MSNGVVALGGNSEGAVVALGGNSEGGVVALGGNFEGGAIVQPSANEMAMIGGRFHWEFLRGTVVGPHYSGPRLFDEDESHNIVCTAGKVYVTGVALLTTTQIALSSWYIGIATGTPTFAAADTSASHAGWTECVAYAEAVRQAWSGVADGVGGATNSAAKSAFTINAANTVVGGSFLISNSTKSGTTGTLMSGSALTGGNRTLQSSDIVRITYSWASN